MNTNLLGIYTLSYTSCDYSGNCVTKTRTVFVIDTIAPVISLNGADTVKALLGSTYIDSGATVSDNYWIHTVLKDSTNLNINKTGIYYYTYYGTDSSGNKAIPVSRIVIVYPKGVSASFTVADTVCIHNPASFVNTSKSASCGTINSWLWAFGDGSTDTAQSPSHTYLSAGAYIVKLIISSSGGCTDSIVKNIFADSTCVWPGDANNDKVADTNDVLQIGIAYGEKGAKRANASTNWEGQYCANWAKNFSNGANHKHADCNGDGVVDSNDVKVVHFNYGDTHMKTGANNTGSPSDPPFSISYLNASYNPGDTVTGFISLGTKANAMINIYGLETSFDFDPAYVDTNTLKINFYKSWFGTPGSDLIGFSYPEYAGGKVLLAITRINHVNQSGYGTIGTVNFIIPQNAPGNKSVKAGFGPSKIISFDETILPVFLPADTFAVNTTTEIQSIGNMHINLMVAPNPFASAIIISYSLGKSQNVQLTVTDITGKQIAILADENQNAGQHTYSLDAAKYNMPAGIYFLRIIAGNDATETKIVRVK